MAYRILFVCTGNICRSPTAELVFRQMIEEAGMGKKVLCDSCGTQGYHVGEKPDPRAMNVAYREGFDIADHTARQLHPNDFTRFNLILAMDEGHLLELQRQKPNNATAKLDLFLNYAGMGNKNVPDPYYDGHEVFIKSLKLIIEGCDQIVQKLRTQVPA